jgi:hypothetical protein
LLVLKLTRQRRLTHAQEPRVAAALVLAPSLPTMNSASGAEASGAQPLHPRWAAGMPRHDRGVAPRPGLLRDASAIYREAVAHGDRLSQRTLARQLRSQGHRFPNEHLRGIADSIGLTTARAA